MLSRLSCVAVLLLTGGCSGEKQPQPQGKPIVDPTKKIVFELRKAVLDPMDGYIEARYRDGEKKVYVFKEPGLVTQDVAKAAPDDAGGHPGIDVYFTAEGIEKLKKLSREHVGQYLAIMVDGKVVSLPKILTELPMPGVLITGQWPAEEVNRIVKALNSR